MENPNILQLDFGFKIEPIPKQQPINSKKAKENFVFEFMDALTSPIIVFPSAWQDTVPSDLLDKITMSRMICMMKGEQMASLTEVVAYIMPRTFESPMHSEWVNIYTWCGLQYAYQFNDREQKKEIVSAMTEIAPQNLSDYEQHLLKKLRVWIYNQRRKALKAKMAKDTKKAKVKTRRSNQEELF